MNKILCVEDSPETIQILETALTGHHLSFATTIQQALQLLNNDHFNMLLLDVELPDGNGFEVLAVSAERLKNTGVIFLTGRRDFASKVSAFSLGADDFIEKPFDPKELLARMRAVVRRKGGSGAPLLVCGELSLDPASHEAEFQGARVRLSGREFALLEALVRRPGAIVSRADLEQKIYGWDQEVDINTVEVLVYGLRRKLCAGVIRTVRGVGYMVDPRP